MTQDIDVNNFAETLNDKLDRDLKNSAFNMDLVIAYKAPTNEDPTWYRQYKSGWVEQGGQFIKTANPTYCTLPVVMANAFYYINTSFNSNNSVSKYEKTAYFLKETTRFGMKMGSYNAQETNTDSTTCIWEVKGFAANPEDSGDDESTYGNVYKTYYYRNALPDYSTYTDMTNPFTAPADGIAIWNNSGTGSPTVNGVTIATAGNDASNEGPVSLPLSKGDVLTFSPDTGLCRFYPYKQPSQSTDPSVTTLVDAIWPVGSIYIGTTVNCPLASIIGTWEKIDGDLVLQSSSQAHQAGTTIEPGLPNITGKLALGWDNSSDFGSEGSFYKTNNSSQNVMPNGAGTQNYRQTFDASRSSSIYGNSNTVQPPAFVVNIWKRTA